MGWRIGAGAGIMAGVIGLGYSMWEGWKAGGAKGLAEGTTGSLTGFGFDGSWDWTRMTFTLPTFAGCGVSYAAAKTGVNRYTPKGWNI